MNDDDEECCYWPIDNFQNIYKSKIEKKGVAEVNDDDGAADADADADADDAGAGADAESGEHINSSMLFILCVIFLCIGVILIKQPSLNLCTYIFSFTTTSTTLFPVVRSL